LKDFLRYHFLEISCSVFVSRVRSLKPKFLQGFPDQTLISLKIFFSCLLNNLIR
jgi:hypothetical protein